MSGKRVREMPNAYWNGEPCIARRVLIRVGDCPFPQGWYKELVGTEMRAVEVKYRDHPFYLADEDGNGWHKVTVEGGGPHRGHKPVTCAEVLKYLVTADLDVNECHCTIERLPRKRRRRK